MDFLACLPTVFVVGNEYEILVNCKRCALIKIRIDGKDYYEKNSGVLSTEKKYAKIRVPQSVLNRAVNYTVICRESIDRRAYFPLLGEEYRQSFEFHSLPGDNIKIYHVADVHGRFALAESCADYFGGHSDLIIVNGDLGEVEKESDYLDSCRFLGNVAKGEYPVIFTRGNHDARGRLAERFSQYFPSDDGDFFYRFSIGKLCGIVFDCGEDKVDEHPEYGGDGETVTGVNAFAEYRRRQTRFLQNLPAFAGKPVIAVGHIPPMRITENRGDLFDIERATYAAWCGQFERLGVSFMLAGHKHYSGVLFSGDKRNLLPHSYPVIIGSECSFNEKGENENLVGTAITISGNDVLVRFTDKDKKIKGEYTFKLS